MKFNLIYFTCSFLSPFCYLLQTFHRDGWLRKQRWWVLSLSFLSFLLQRVRDSVKLAGSVTGAWLPTLGLWLWQAVAPTAPSCPASLSGKWWLSKHHLSQLLPWYSSPSLVNFICFYYVLSKFIKFFFVFFHRFCDFNRIILSKNDFG